MMFGKKIKNKDSRRTITAKLGDWVLFNGDLEGLPLKEEWILKKSVEFFDDPEPCYIHRGAVAIRLLNEIWEKAADIAGVESEYADYPEGTRIFRN